MFMLKVYRYMTGCVKFIAKGVFPERFLNLCAKEDILIWNPKVKNNELTGYMHVHDYLRIRKIARKSCMRMRVKRRIGFPFLIKRYRFRYGIPVGAAVFAFLLWYLSGFCFNITITGDSFESYEKTLGRLEKCGVYIGQRTNNIDPETSRQQFLINNREYAWAAINIKGSFVEVVLTQTTEKNMRNKDKTPCNIVADCDGEILKIKAYEGKISVKVGEAVTKGDLLVSGVIELTNKTTKFVRADAEVIAQTRHKFQVFVPFENTEELTTDETQTRSVISVAGVDIPLFLGEVKSPYKVKREVKNYEIDGIRLPLKKTTATFTKIIKKKITLSKAAAKIAAKEKMDKKAEKKLGDTITKVEKEEYKFTEKGVFLTKVYLCKKNIASYQKILK